MSNRYATQFIIAKCLTFVPFIRRLKSHESAVLGENREIEMKKQQELRDIGRSRAQTGGHQSAAGRATSRSSGNRYTWN